MRFVSYVVAVLVAAGLIYYIGQSPDAPVAAGAPAEADGTEAPQSQAGSVTAPSVGESGAAQQVTLRVPKMHCPFGCYPQIKKTLENEPGVLAVELAEQQQEGAIDNPVVHIQTSGEFDAQAAIDALAKAGFDQSTTVQ